MCGATIDQIEVRDVRNLVTVEIEPACGTNILFGDNGQGKTSLLEAIYWLATTKSFRTTRLRELIRHGASGCHVHASILDQGTRRHQQIGMTGAQRTQRIDGKVPERVSSYAVRTPVVVFHPSELALTMGPASERRRLIDRVGLFVDSRGYEIHRAYKAAMKARQQLLKQQGENAKGLEAYETLMARDGGQLMRFRLEVLELLEAQVQQAFEQLAPDGVKLRWSYEPGGCLEPELFLKHLYETRRSDAIRGSAGFGPHRDDWSLRLTDHRGERSVRTDGSQGQHRMLTLAVKLAEMACIERSSNRRPILLLDDVSSELDEERTKAFFDVLATRHDQVFLTTTRLQMMPIYEGSLGESKVWQVRDGQVRAG